MPVADDMPFIFLRLVDQLCLRYGCGPQPVKRIVLSEQAFKELEYEATCLLQRSYVQPYVQSLYVQELNRYNRTIQICGITIEMEET